MAGVGELVVALQAISERAQTVGGRAAASAMGTEGERAIKQRLSMSSHSRGTKTPSPPGAPPSLISGALRRSVLGEGPTGGGGRWVYTVRPTIVYARIQEKGGWAGRGHKTHLPARPYVAPAVRELVMSGRLERAAASAFQREVFG